MDNQTRLEQAAQKHQLALEAERARLAKEQAGQRAIEAAAAELAAARAAVEADMRAEAIHIAADAAAVNAHAGQAAIDAAADVARALERLRGALAACDSTFADWRAVDVNAQPTAAPAGFWANEAVDRAFDVRDRAAARAAVGLLFGLGLTNNTSISLTPGFRAQAAYAEHDARAARQAAMRNQSLAHAEAWQARINGGKP